MARKQWMIVEKRKHVRGFVNDVSRQSSCRNLAERTDRILFVWHERPRFISMSPLLRLPYRLPSTRRHVDAQAKPSEYRAASQRSLCSDAPPHSEPRLSS